MVSPPQWSSGAARAHAVVVSVLTPAEVLIAARRLAGTRPHLAAVAGLVHPKDQSACDCRIFAHLPLCQHRERQAHINHSGVGPHPAL
jgi:hypothetical protein